MSYLPRIYIYLTIVAILLLTISLSASAQDSNAGAGSTYEQFKNIKEVCKSRRQKQIVRVHSKCKVEVQARKCSGFCRSLTDFLLEPPYLTRDCACCKPYGKVTYKVEEHKCFQLDKSTAGVKKYTGDVVKIAVPHEMDCKCVRCSRISSG